MIFASNVHTHSTFCDGENSPQEIADAAIELGFTDLGFSSHSPAPFDPVCPGVKSEDDYRKAIAQLKKEYHGKLNIMCGMETDTYAPVCRQNYDYIIGSSHFLPVVNGEYIAVDGDKNRLLSALKNRYSGDGIAMAKDYYNLQYKGICQQRPSIVGHFDLIKKYNGEGLLFCEDGNAYKSLATNALDRVLDVLDEYGGMLEVNTGAITKMARSDPYPSLFLLEHGAMRGAKVIISADSHKKTTLNAHFSIALSFIKKAGFKEMWVLKGKEFVPISVNTV